MKKILIISGTIFLGVFIATIALFFALNNYIYNEKQAKGPETPLAQDQVGLTITPISHATMVLNWDGKIIYVDPVGGGQTFDSTPRPDLILITDNHGDHLNIETLEAVTTQSTKIIAPQTVFDELTDQLKTKTTVLKNNEVINQDGFGIQGVPMYNLPESEDAYHVKGRGNGYIIENDDRRVYIAGDTADIPEMRNLQDIDIAFIPMNLPYTMDVETAADAVLEFKPKQVYPYHYRTPDGPSDTNRFRELINEADSNIEVVLLDWYPSPR